MTNCIPSAHMLVATTLVVAFSAVLAWLPRTPPPCRAQFAPIAPAANARFERPRLSATTAGDGDVPEVEVLPPAPPPARLSDASVARVLELVWRDTRKVASEYRVGDLSRTIAGLMAANGAANQTGAAMDSRRPPWTELVNDRLPILAWWVSYRADLSALACSEFLAASRLSPRSRADLRRWRTVLERRLDQRRARLWPTLRTLLLTPSMHRRVVTAARSQLLTSHGGDPSLARRRTLALILGSPVRLLRLWLGAARAVLYGARWLLNEFGLRWLLSPRRRQAVRVSLIERAIDKGLELQRTVEGIEESAAEADAQAARKALLPLTLTETSLGGTEVALDQVGVQQAALTVARWTRRLQGGRSRGDEGGVRSIM